MALYGALMYHAIRAIRTIDSIFPIDRPRIMLIRHLETFQTVVRRGSFLAAAQELGCAQSTVTLHIQQLEATLGAELFDRGTRRVRLTEAGRALQEQAGPILNRVSVLQETMAELAAGEAGHLRIGAIEPTTSLRLPQLLVRYNRDRPNVRLSVELGGTDGIAQRVAAGALDVGICSPPPPGLGLTFEPLFRETLALLVPDTHALADRPVIRVPDLGDRPLLLTEPTCAYRELTERMFRDQGVNLDCRVVIGSTQALVSAVRAGLGVAIVPVVAACPPPVGTRLRELEGSPITLAVGLVRAADAPPPGRALSALLAEFRSHLPRLPAVTAPAA
jgi:DNA-binding transcriptional LysR family regulator